MVKLIFARERKRVVNSRNNKDFTKSSLYLQLNVDGNAGIPNILD